MNLPCAVRIEVLQPVNFDSIGQKESNVKEQERADWEKSAPAEIEINGQCTFTDDFHLWLYLGAWCS